MFEEEIQIQYENTKRTVRLVRTLHIAAAV